MSWVAGADEPPTPLGLGSTHVAGASRTEVLRVTIVLSWTGLSSASWPRQWPTCTAWASCTGTSRYARGIDFKTSHPHHHTRPRAPESRHIQLNLTQLNQPENILVEEEDPADASSASSSSNGAASSSSGGGITTVGSHPPPPPPQPVVKLLDFGLSKLIDPKGGGSTAKTFVGTRAYLAPEVELLAHGQGRDYGTPADCWSMGTCASVREFWVADSLTECVTHLDLCLPTCTRCGAARGAGGQVPRVRRGAQGGPGGHPHALLRRPQGETTTTTTCR